jgi:deoxyribose-phosphate aldolase
LKVILETGELATYDNVRRASRIAILAGADFIKTSTGKVKPAATMPVVLLMLEAVRDHFLETGRLVGVKAAGGISSAKIALRYLAMINETVGDHWMTSELFRFGASSLVNDLLMQLARLDDGNYQRPEEFSKD